MTINVFLNQECKNAMNLTDFVENFYAPCFKDWEWVEKYESSYRKVQEHKMLNEDDYLREKWHMFRRNPLQYIGSMDNQTIQYFALAIHNSYTDPLEKS